MRGSNKAINYYDLSILCLFNGAVSMAEDIVRRPQGATGSVL